MAVSPPDGSCGARRRTSKQIAYRDVDYVEDAYDAYDAGILEMAFGVAW
jgi:hypothetical protein